MWFEYRNVESQERGLRRLYKFGSHKHRWYLKPQDWMSSTNNGCTWRREGILEGSPGNRDVQRSKSRNIQRRLRKSS